MKIFLDSANIQEIREINELGFLSGVTTNPSLVAKEKGNFHQMVKEICGIVDGPVNAEPLGISYDAMIREGETLAAIHPNVVVKIPMCEDGLRAISFLKKQGIQTNATLVFSANQAILAARAGARYISPFVGRIDDIGNDGINVLAEIIMVLDQYALDAEVIAASIRHTMHVTEVAKIGSHIATVPYKVIKAMVKHPLTDLGIAKFVEDGEKYLGKN
ncbi:MAG: fructose-6-phosphate aldolase [Syntrophomonadaceae bacterium]|nr:fructose-6-phosphate aldolase [Syntrophomonadaceae bacterium]